MKKLLIIPTYEESSNVSTVIQKINEANIDDLDIILIDDSPTEKTEKVIQEEQKKYSNVFFRKRKVQKPGIASAYIEGFNYAFQQGYNIIIQMDADLSHNPESLPELLEKSNFYSFVVGSRYVHKGVIKNWGWTRKMISAGGNYISKKILSMPINDLTSGFNVWHSCVLNKINFNKIQSRGYFFQIEIKYLSFKNGFTFTELPIVFEERKKGNSKFRIGIILEALRELIKIKHK